MKPDKSGKSNKKKKKKKKKKTLAILTNDPSISFNRVLILDMTSTEGCFQ